MLSLFKKKETKPTIVMTQQMEIELESPQERANRMIRKIYRKCLDMIHNHILEYEGAGVSRFHEDLVQAIHKVFWDECSDVFSYFLPYSENEMIKFGMMDEKEQQLYTAKKALRFWAMLHDRTERQRIIEFVQYESNKERFRGLDKYYNDNSFKNEANVGFNPKRFFINKEGRLTFAKDANHNDLRMGDCYLG